MIWAPQVIEDAEAHGLVLAEIGRLHDTKLGQHGQKCEGVPDTSDRHEVRLVHRGHWRLTWPGGATTLAPGDTCAVPPGLERSLAPTMTGEPALFLARSTTDPTGPTRH